MNAMERLKELASGWYISLTHDGTEWTLEIWPRTFGSKRAHVYVSADLERLINHAWAGAPEGRV